MLFAAGLVHPNEVTDMFGGANKGLGHDFYDRNFTEKELLGIEYAVLCDSDYFDAADGKITKSYLKNGKRIEDSGTFVDGHCGIKMKVSGIVRPNKNASASAIQGVVGYPHAVVEALVERCQSLGIIGSQFTNCYQVVPSGSGYKIVDGKTVASIDEDGNLVYSVKSGLIAFVSVLDTIGQEITKDRIIEKSEIVAVGQYDTKAELESKVLSYMKTTFGYAELDNPDKIQIYAANFEGKKNILKVLDNYQYYVRESNADGTYTWVNTGVKDENHSIKYTDMLQTIMGYVEKMTNAMITALIAFSAVSLIVSSIMISIITYTSVLERRKEIGVLRSIGARKLDVSNLFISETSIIGMISGALGIGFGYLLIYIANVIIKKVIEIPNLLHLDWYYAISLFVISFFLSMIAGIIPAAIAANKDPVECLRSE